MWLGDFASRLDSWTSLRSRVRDLDQEQCLQEVNAWWFQTPWANYYLHWDDRTQWPDPWQLLQDNIYCDVARGLGILYTLALLERADIQDAKLVEAGSDNLVLVGGEKYTLNWEPDIIVNICPDKVNIRRVITQQEAFKKIS